MANDFLKRVVLASDLASVIGAHQGPHMSNIQEELASATRRFYIALNSFLKGDTSFMHEIWADDERISVTHPMGTWSMGREDVHDCWEALLPLFPDGGNVECAQLCAYPLGDDMGYTLCIEATDVVAGGKRLQFTSRSTNIFCKVGTTWKIMHHHVDRAPDLQLAVMG